MGQGCSPDLSGLNTDSHEYLMHGQSYKNVFLLRVNSQENINIVIVSKNILEPVLKRKIYLLNIIF